MNCDCFSFLDLTVSALPDSEEPTAMTTPCVFLDVTLS